MHEVKIGSVPYLTEEQERITDMHSFFNVLNVVIGELSLVCDSAPEHVALIEPYQRKLDQVALSLRESEFAHQHVLELDRQCQPILEMLAEVEAQLKCAERREEVVYSRENLLSVFKILKQRVIEFGSSGRKEDEWQWMPCEVFRARLVDVFEAIQRNARGHYRICYKSSDCGTCDYYVDLSVESDDARGFFVPLRMQDVVRDLAANSRKYTDPGGQIKIVLSQGAEGFSCRVEDTGLGIPRDELSRVVEFGFRASNVQGKRSFGGGFGLTKVAWLIQRWGGALSIASELGIGTRIGFSVPIAVNRATSVAAAEY